jgi:hypothetical protein
MDRDLAWTVVRKVFRVSAELQDLLRELKMKCNPDDYRAYAMAVAAVVDRANVELLDPTLSRFPDLEQRIARDLSQHGHLT